MKFCKIIITITFIIYSGSSQANKWDIFSNPNEEILKCFKSNKLKESEIKILENGRPDKKSLRKKAKKVIKSCKNYLGKKVTNKIDNRKKTSQIFNTSPFGKDLQLLKYEPNKIQEGTFLLVVPQKNSYGRVLQITNNAKIIWQHDGNSLFGRLDDAKLTYENTILIAAEKGVYEIDRESKIIWSYKINVSHDVDKLSNGNILINYAWGPKGSQKIIEVDNKKNVVWGWDGMETHNVKPFADTYASDSNIFGSSKTWIHNNGVTALTDDTFLISMRDFQEIIWINRKSDIIKKYIFNCVAKKRALLTSGKIRGCNPHEPQQLQNGNIVVGLRNPNRAIEFNPKTDDIIWQWRSPKSSAYGTIRDVDKLKNGNYVVVTGSHLLEINSNGEVVLDIGANKSLSQDHRILYKAQKIYPDGTFSHD
ncbi:aryl-sulfate sulfotransferase [bacterium]|nr:aryl-sulfate sulfotransferase [bacterium]